MSMKVRQITTVAELEALEPEWRRLAAGDPISWLAGQVAEWRGFGTHAQLCVLLVSDPREGVVAIAPWYLERTTLRWLESGAACSGFRSLPCVEGFWRRATTAMADWLCPRADVQGAPAISWDALVLDGVAADDPVVRALLGALERRACAIAWRAAHDEERDAPGAGVDVCVFSGRWSGRLRHACWQGGTRAKNWPRAEHSANDSDEVVSIPFRAARAR
jgi:hypothetical protein